MIHSYITYFYLHVNTHVCVCVYASHFFLICIPSNDLPTMGADTFVCVRVFCSLSRLRRTALVCLSLVRAGEAGLVYFVEMGLARQERTSR